MTEAVDQILANIEAERARLRAEFDEQMRRLDAAAAALQATLTTAPSAKPGRVPRELLAGCRSVREALLVIAQRNGGRVRVSDVKDQIADSGFIHVKSGSRWDVVNGTMKRSPKLFKMIGGGVYELTEAGRRFDPGRVGR